MKTDKNLNFHPVTLLDTVYVCICYPILCSDKLNKLGKRTFCILFRPRMLVVLFVSENSTTRVTRLHLGQSREQNTSVDTLQQKVVKGHDMGQVI